MSFVTSWRLLAVGALLGLSLTPGSAQTATEGAAIAQHGIGSVPACATCHGAEGQGNPAIGAPRVAGDGVDYLRRQLDDFATGRRKNPIMQPIAHGLTQAQRQAAAQFFAGLPALTPHPAPSAGNELGAQLADRGRWSEGLPACSQCHGPDGMGVPPNFPHLAGLTAKYITQQLDAFRGGQRPAGPLGLMKRVASKLSPADIAAVSTYFAAMSGTAPPGTRTGVQTGGAQSEGAGR